MVEKAKTLIAIVGAGRMGTGIAQVFAYAGYQVELIDVKKRGEEASQQVLQAASDQIAANLKFLASLGIMDAVTLEDILKRIAYRRAQLLDEILPEAQVVFEAVPEVLQVKETVLGQISSAVDRRTIIASTTSTFMADVLASFVEGRERFLNTHWLNPAYLIPLVEVSPCRDTAPEALQRTIQLLEAAGKIPIKCAPSPGFIVPRIQALAMNEAARLVEEGVASPEDIDKAVKVGFGLRFAVLGLLEFIDWGGGDILYYADNYLKEALQSNRFSAPRIITDNMEKGHIGMKSGQGFYNFSSRDVALYQKETIKKFVDLLNHLGLLVPPAKKKG